MTHKTKAGTGSDFDDFLKAEGLYHEANQAALLRVFAWKLNEARKAGSVTKLEMAKRMKTSRPQLDRILDPKDDNVKLSTLVRAANALGCRVHIDLIPEQKR